ncbi:hypothetical protein [Gracilibacillus massiliensis]|uniref:hypothetical protein n=1 Tax=Gracilibacillus massiliensis TaxID=1564956 RepID=UPI00071C7A0E|nr:hypothetical protein [Gracilibacillus massiliensis]
MNEFYLSASVGTNGVNDPEDIFCLKEHLFKLGYHWIQVNDQLDKDLTDIINLIQSMKAGRNKVHGDGRVDVPGPTYDWLRAENAPRWLLMPEGDQITFANIERAQEWDHHDYGTSWLDNTIQQAAVWYRDHYLQLYPEASPITINDVSLETGGNTPDHRGHETGLACDLRLPSIKGTAPGGITIESKNYDRSAMRAMVSAFNIQPLTTAIYFNDRRLIEEGLCEYASHHDDHAHIEIKPLVPLVDYSDRIGLLWQQTLSYFDGENCEPTEYPMTLDGFQTYIEDVGVNYFSAEEMLTPHHPDIARQLGMNLFLPPHKWWKKGAALVSLADQIRELVNEPVRMRNWWRPLRYNQHPIVGGSLTSDHITADGIDIDFRSTASRKQAEEYLLGLYEQEDWLELSLGLGGRSIHFGFLSPNKKRKWYYKSYHSVTE